MVFDFLLIKRLLSEGHRVTLVGRGRPVVNDMTKTDLEELLNRAEVDEYFQGVDDWKERISVISSGSDVAGTNLRQATPEFVDAWVDSHIRIAKGQGNWETLRPNALTKPVFYSFLVKEPRMILNAFPRGARVLFYHDRRDPGEIRQDLLSEHPTTLIGKLSADVGSKRIPSSSALRMVRGLVRRGLFLEEAVTLVPPLGQHLKMKKSLEDRVTPLFIDQGVSESIVLDADLKRIIQTLVVFAKAGLARQEIDAIIGPLIKPLVGESTLHGNVPRWYLPLQSDDSDILVADMLLYLIAESGVATDSIVRLLVSANGSYRSVAAELLTLVAWKPRDFQENISYLMAQRKWDRVVEFGPRAWPFIAGAVRFWEPGETLNEAVVAIGRIQPALQNMSGSAMKDLLRLRADWLTNPPHPASVQRFAQAIAWLPPVGGKVPVVVEGTQINSEWRLLSPTWTAEEQIEELLKRRRMGELGSGYVHQMTVQGRLPDEFKYVALALILASPYWNNWEEPFFEAPWGKVAPLVHDGGNVEMGLNPLWKEVEGRTDFLQRVVRVYVPNLEEVERLSEAEQIRRQREEQRPGEASLFERMESEEEEYERERLMLEARAYQRLALALHAKVETAPQEIPEEIRVKLAQHWDEFRTKMDALLRKFGLVGAARVKWFTKRARQLAGWDGPRQEARWEPIRRELIKLEKARAKYPQLIQQANQLLRTVTGAIDQDLGLAAGLEQADADQTPEPLLGTSDFAALGGTARSWPEMALESYLRQEGVIPALERNGGLLRLSAEQAGRLLSGQIQRWGEAVKGAVLVRGGDSATAALRAGQVILADSDLSNPLDYAWTKVGPDWADLEKAMPVARRGDLLLGEERDVTPEAALNSLRARFPAGEAPVVILGTQAGVYGLSPSEIRTYQDLALEVRGEPEVWVLSVSVRLQERAGETFHLIIRL